MEGLLIQEKSLHTTTISRNDPAGRMFLDKTQQLFTKSGTTWNLKVDKEIYIEICNSPTYFSQMSNEDRFKCINL